MGWDPSDIHLDDDWLELASITAGGSSTNLSSGTITARKYLWVQAYLEPASSSAARMSFNNDSTSYALRRADNGASDTTSINQSFIELFSATTTPIFVNIFIVNISAREKLVIGSTVNQNTAGVTVSPNRREFIGKWDNTASQITEIDLDSSSGNWNNNSRVNVWGFD